MKDSDNLCSTEEKRKNIQHCFINWCDVEFKFIKFIVANIYDAASHITRIWLTFNYDISKSYLIGYGRFLPEYEKMWLCCPLVMTQLKSLKLQHRRTKLKTRTKIQLSEHIPKRCSALAALIKERKNMTNYTTSLNDPSMRSNDWGHTRTVCRQQQWPIDLKHWL